MTSVFLSYARADDEPFVARVYEFLEAHHFDVWWDRKDMPARALAFTEEIRDAIHRSDRLLVVIGPRALRSDYVRAEWQSALSERKPVVTALRLVPAGTNDPHACLPAELRIFHAESFLVVDGKEPPLDPLRRLLSDPVPPPPPIFGCPPERPPHFLPRPDKFNELFGAVLGETIGPTVRTHESRVTVVTGMGGIGKSVLALSLVDAMRSRPTTFVADGIYWLAGDPLRRLAALCHARITSLYDDRDVCDALAQQFEGKRFLLVVDNATSVDQIAPLVRVLGPGGRMLVTTRHGELAVGHHLLRIDQLGEEEALRLAADWMGTPPQALPLAVRSVVKLCGYHPFAIALNAAAAGQGVPWSAIVTALEKRELDYAEHCFEEYVYETVEQSLRISLDALPTVKRARYLELAAFFWEGAVPAAAILRLWKHRSGLSEHRGQRLLVFFQQRSLLQLHGSPEQYDVRLHDLHLMYIGRDEKKTASLGRALLDAYRPPQEAEWWRLPDDGYLHRNLVRHLLRSRHPSHALALMSAEDDEGRNAWYRTRVHASLGSAGGEDGFSGYVVDLSLVSARVSDCLLVLVAASLRSLARTVPAALLDAAVADGGWSVQRAIARSRLLVEPAKRARAMIALLARVQDRERWLDETLVAIADSDVTDRGDLVRALALALEETELLPVLRRVADWTLATSSRYEQTHTNPLLRPLLDRVPAPLAAQAVAIAHTIGFRPLRLYGMLQEPERSLRIGHAMAEYRDKRDTLSVAMHAWTVSELAEYLDPTTAASAIAQAYVRVRELASAPLHNHALALLLRHLPPDEQRETLRELIAEARADPQEFIELARHAPPSLHGPIRAAIVDQPLAWIAAVAPLLAGEDRRALMSLVLTQMETSERSTSLLWMHDGQLLLAMNHLELDRTKALIEAQLNGAPRVDALIAVARVDSASHRAQALRDILAAIDSLGDANERERAYERAAPLLSGTQLAAALASAERIGEPSGLGQVVKLLPHLAAPERRRATELIADQARRNGIRECHRALLAMPRSCKIGKAEALTELALGLDNHHGRAHLLVALAPRVGGPGRERIAAEARAAIAEHEQARTRMELLLELGTADEAERELEHAAAAMDADELARAVAMIASRLDAGRAASWVERALARGKDGKHLLETLAPHLSAETAWAYLVQEIGPTGADFDEWLRWASDRSFPFIHEDEPAATAGALARRLGTIGRANAAFELVRLGKDNEVTTSVLVELGPWLSREDVLEIERRVAFAELGTMSVACRIGRQSVGREYLAARLAPALARVGEVDRAVHCAARADEASRIEAYLRIAAATSGETRSRTLLQTLDAVLAQREVYRNEQIDEVACALASDTTACARLAWSRACDWARSQARKDAIEVLASMAPVAVAAEGSGFVNEVFRAIERVVRWWR
ncbi:MAG: TIR domain-containing protein [Burkholderiaceae bacterium]